MLQVPLHPGLPGGRWACLRPLAGHDEAQAQAAGATQLLARLLVSTPGTTVTPERLGELTVADRDRLLAAMYRQCFGDRVEGEITCHECGEGFELSFSLAQLTARQNPGELELSTGPDEEGYYRLPDGRRFRLPTLADQASVAGLQPGVARAELLARCLADRDGLDDDTVDDDTVDDDTVDDDTVDDDTVDDAMSEAGPLLDLDLDAPCSECGAQQLVRFDVVSYLLAALRREKAWLHREVHCLARVYGWSWNEILSLPREERRAYVRLVSAEQRRPGGFE